MQSDPNILSLLVRFLYIVLWKGHFEQWTDMSLPCLNLCHRIHFQSNIIIIPTIKFVKTKRIQFVETQAFYKNFTTTSILLHFNMSFEFDYFLHIQPSCLHFRLRCRVGCFGLNDPLRQYFSLYRAVSQREGERKER